MSTTAPGWGLDRSVRLVFMASTLEEAAFLALTIALPFVRLNRFLKRLNREEEFLRQHGYPVQLSRCNS